MKTTKFYLKLITILDPMDYIGGRGGGQKRLCYNTINVSVDLSHESFLLTFISSKEQVSGRILSHISVCCWQWRNGYDSWFHSRWRVIRKSTLVFFFLSLCLLNEARVTQGRRGPLRFSPHWTKYFLQQLKRRFWKIEYALFRISSMTNSSTYTPRVYRPTV